MAMALACVGLSCAGAAPASAGACPNEQFRSGPSEGLPDCRAYEQVSPAEKGGVDAVTIQPLFPAQASDCAVGGEACGISYMNAASAFAGAQGNELPNAYMARRAAGGWQTTPLTPPMQQPPAIGSPLLKYAFSSDLSQTVLRVPLQRLTPNAPEGIYNLFLRHPDGSYALVTAATPEASPQPGCGACFVAEDASMFAGASSDFSHVMFEADDSLVEGAPGEFTENLYETVAEHVRLVGILPDKEIPPKGAKPGGGINAIEERASHVERAMSSDGSHIVFQAAADGGAPAPAQRGRTQVYDRIDASSTTELSAPAPGAEPAKCETKGGLCLPEASLFQAAAADGSVVYFTSKASLTKQSFTGEEVAKTPTEEEEEIEFEEFHENPGNDLYRYDVGTGTLTDLTVDTAPADPNGAEVLGVVGSSTDGSYLYFVATGDLAPGATGGEPNLYVWHGSPEGAGTIAFIATLKAPTETEQEDIEELDQGEAFHYRSDVADWTRRPVMSQAYVTPDGRHLAFMSVNQLTGYDNEDQITKEHDHEVFEYSAETGGLVCVSCDASGERPLGSAFIGAKLTERMSSPFHQPRVLSNDGSRAFFSSPDPLAPGVPRGNSKIFEYEGGAPHLIAGAGNLKNVVFLDATASGDDVFLASRERLAGGDRDELVDVYDARVGGGLPAPPEPPPPCRESACQGPAGATPQFTAPNSASFTGTGNLAAPPPPAAAAKLTSKQLLARALAKCRKLRNAKKRSRCVAAARRRYSPKAKKGRRASAHVPGRSARHRR